MADQRRAIIGRQRDAGRQIGDRARNLDGIGMRLAMQEAEAVTAAALAHTHPRPEPRIADHRIPGGF